MIPFTPLYPEPRQRRPHEEVLDSFEEEITPLPAQVRDGVAVGLTQRKSVETVARELVARVPWERYLVGCLVLTCCGVFLVAIGGVGLFRLASSNLDHPAFHAPIQAAGTALDTLNWDMLRPSPSFDTALARNLEKSSAGILRRPMRIPVVIRLIFVGHGTPGIPANESLHVWSANEGSVNNDGWSYAVQHLGGYLQSFFPRHAPSIVNLKSGVQSLSSAIEYELDYRTVRCSDSENDEIEEILVSHMTSFDRSMGPPIVDAQDSSLPPGMSEWVVDAEMFATEAESVLSRYMTSSDDSVNSFNFVILAPRLYSLLGLVNSRPDISSLSVSMRYSHRYEGGRSVSAFHSGDHSVWVDLSSGPNSRGSAIFGEGGVSPSRIPRMFTFDPSGRVEVREETTGQRLAMAMSPLVSTAVRTVFLPDAGEVKIHSENIFVPIIVMRNHRSYDLLDPSWPNALDVPAIKREVNKLALPGQKINVVAGVHSLHEHPHISLAVAEAIQDNTVFVVNNGRFVPLPRPHLNSASLKASLQGTSDELIGSLLRYGGGEGRGSVADESGSEPRNSPGESDLSSQMRVLPVYIFSLMNVPDFLLIDGESFFIATPEMIIVLEMHGRSVMVPFYDNGSPLFGDAGNPTRSVVAGLASSLGGLIPPTSFYSRAHGTLKDDHLFAGGHTCFGHFANTVQLSHLAKDIFFRNAILEEISTALNLTRSVVDEIREFAKEYVFDPLGNLVSISYRDTAGIAGADDSAWHAAMKYPLNFVPHVIWDISEIALRRMRVEQTFGEDTMASLVMQLGEMEQTFEEVRIQMAKMEYASEAVVARAHSS